MDNSKNIILLRIYRYLGILLVIIASILFITYFIEWIINGMTTPLGQNMVEKEIYIIPNIIMMKPITLSIILGITGYTLSLESIINPLSRISLDKLRLIEIIAILFLAISAYELIFNFMIWSALITIHAGNTGIESINIDLIYTSFPYTTVKWNIVFATKFFYMLMIISILTIYFINRWIRKSAQ